MLPPDGCGREVVRASNRRPNLPLQRTMAAPVSAQQLRTEAVPCQDREGELNAGEPVINWLQWEPLPRRPTWALCRRFRLGFAGRLANARYRCGLTCRNQRAECGRVLSAAGTTMSIRPGRAS